MTFSWKKKTRFSKLVADHLQSPKRGSSLVVETGFPTSLIDLYVRNRGRFHKFSEKKRTGDDSLTALSSESSSMDLDNLSQVASGYTSGCTVSGEIIEDDFVGIDNVDVNCGVISVDRVEDERGVIFVNSSEIVEEEMGVDIANSSKIREELGFEIGNSGRIEEDESVVQVLSSNKIVEEGCLEIVHLTKVDDERCFERANQYRIEEERDVQNANVSIVEDERGVKAVDLSKFEEQTRVERSDSSEVEEDKRVAKAKSNWVLVAALKVLFLLVLALGTKRFTVGITLLAFLLSFLESVGKPLLGRLSLICYGCTSEKLLESHFQGTENLTVVVCNQVSEINEIDSKKDVMSEKNLNEVRCEILTQPDYKHSRRAKMKSKMKKLVPKKLRTSKKSCLDSKSGFKEEDSVELEQDQKPQSHSVVVSNECSSSRGETEQEHDKVVEEERHSMSSGIVCCDNELRIREMQTNSGYLGLCLVVLVGLVVGRILALVLVLSWCLILKKIQKRTVKVHIF